MNPRRNHKILLMTFASLAFWAFAASTAQAYVPSQYIAKIYTEALGRIPDPSGWQDSVNYFTQNPCSRAALKSWGRSVYLSAEYSNLGYDNAAKVLTLYRGILNHEPDPAGFNSYLNQLNSGASWAAVVDSFFDSSEFVNLKYTICDPNWTAYSFYSAPVIAIPTSGSGFQGGTDSDLQAILNSTPPGGTVWLAQKAVVRLSNPLVIPPGVTLATTGNPNHNHYALMGRLVREATFSDAAAKLSSGAKLMSVWVDGSRGRFGFYPDSINVRLLGGSGTTVSDCFISNTAGWTSFQAYGSTEGFPCGSNTITRNLVTVYSSFHTGGGWADGLSISCENALVDSNEIVDATDVGIVLFRATPARQISIVRNNRVLSAGNSAYGALVADPLEGTGQRPDFTGSSIEGNTFWTGPNTHFDIGLSVGTRAWFGTNSDTGTGASFSGNTTGALTARVGTGIGVSGMLNVNVQTNTVNVKFASEASTCPRYSVAASVSSGYASGAIQPYTDVLIQGCIGHP